MKSKLLLSSSLAMMLLAGATQAQEQSPARSQEESTRAFLAHKRDLQAQRNARISDKANLGELNAMVRAVGVTPPAPRFVDQGNLAALNDSFLIDIAQTLSLLGFKAGDLRRSPEQSAAYVQAAAARIRGGASLEQEKLLADTVVLGTVKRTVPSEELGDGLRSTVEIVADQVIKGSVKAGDTIRLRRESGKDSDNRVLRSSIEEPLPDGAKVAIIGSQAFYRNNQAAAGRPCALCLVEQVPVFLVEGQNLVPTGGHDLRPTLATFTAPSK